MLQRKEVKNLMTKTWTRKQCKLLAPSNFSFKRYSSVSRDKQPTYNANLKLFDQITSKKIRPDTSAIRKASIDHLGAAGKNIKPAPSSASSYKSVATNHRPASFDKASLAQSSEKISAILAKQPIDGVFYLLHCFSDTYCFDRFEAQIQTLCKRHQEPSY